MKQKISAPVVMAALEELEGEYGVELAGFVMRVMVGDLYYKNLTANLIIEYNLAPEVAGRLAQDLQNRIFDQVMDYLSQPKAAPASQSAEADASFFGSRGTPIPSAVPAAAAVLSVPGPAKSAYAEATADKPVPPAVRRAPVTNVGTQNLAFLQNRNYLEEDKADITAAGKISTTMKAVPQEKVEAMLAAVIAEAKVSFASSSLLKRFREILLSYLRGVRTKVEVRENLLKDFASGGVKMSEAEADRILNIAQKKLNRR